VTAATWESRQAIGRGVRGLVKWTDADLLEHAANAAESAGGHLSVLVYQRYYEATPGAPAGRTLEMRWGSWNAVMDAAGLPHNPCGRTYERTTAEDCAVAVANVWLAVGRRPTIQEYVAHRGRHPDLGFPGQAIIRQRCGSWIRACEMAEEHVDG
jgi:hypothetical protein